MTQLTQEQIAKCFGVLLPYQLKKVNEIYSRVENGAIWTSEDVKNIIGTDAEAIFFMDGIVNLYAILSPEQWAAKRTKNANLNDTVKSIVAVKNELRK
jgi:hypothetical protein